MKKLKRERNLLKVIIIAICTVEIVALYAGVTAFWWYKTNSDVMEFGCIYLFYTTGIACLLVNLCVNRCKKVDRIYRRLARNKIK